MNRSPKELLGKAIKNNEEAGKMCTATTTFYPLLGTLYLQCRKPKNKEGEKHLRS